jgi:maleylacetoacetate isomerase
MKFYEAVLSSAAFRVRIALALKGLACESVVFDLRAKEHLNDEYRRINPMCSVPALELAPGQALFESMAIVEYLDETHPEPPLLPKDPFARARVRAIAQLVACDIHPLDNLRVLRYLARELKADDAARDRWYAHWIHEGFRGLETVLPQSGSFCHGTAPTVADVFLVPQVVNAIRYKVDIERYPRVRRIYEQCMKLDAFAKAHPDQRRSRS